MACNYYNLDISSLDTGNATGNIGFFDGVVYVSYTDCDGNPQTTFYSDGLWGDAICVIDSSSVSLTYYQNDVAYAAINSSAIIQGSCGVPPTPTATPPVTATPTPTNPYGCFSLTYQGSTTITNNTHNYG